jgi:hypothetical protein
MLKFVLANKRGQHVSHFLLAAIVHAGDFTPLGYDSGCELCPVYQKREGRRGVGREANCIGEEEALMDYSDYMAGMQRDAGNDRTPRVIDGICRS